MVVVLVFSSIQKKLNVYNYLSIDQFSSKNEAKSIKRMFNIVDDNWKK